MKQWIIAISRQYASGGRLIGEKLAEKLGMPFYDKELIARAAKESGISGDFLERAEREGGSLFRNFSESASPELMISDKAYLAQVTAIRAIADQGSCIMVGRAAGAALEGIVPVLNVFVYADLDVRMRRAVEEYGDDPHKIKAHIDVIDKKRASYFKFYTGIDGRKIGQYNLCIDSGFTGIDGAVEVIATAYSLKKNG